MQVDDNIPVYPMGIAAKLLEVHPRTLRIYESEGLISPMRQGGKRVFSKSDLVWIECLRSLIHDENISIEGVKRLLKFAPCWKIKECNKQRAKQKKTAGNSRIIAVKNPAEAAKIIPRSNQVNIWFYISF